MGDNSTFAAKSRKWWSAYLCLNNLFSLFKIHLYFSNSSTIFIYLSWRRYSIEKHCSAKSKSFDNDVMIIKNSRWVPHDSHETVQAPSRLTLSFSQLNSSMAGTKVTPKKGKEECDHKIKTWAQVHVELTPPALVDPQHQYKKTPPSWEEVNKRIKEAEWLEQVGGHQSHC